MYQQVKELRACIDKMYDAAMKQDDERREEINTLKTYLIRALSAFESIKDCKYAPCMFCKYWSMDDTPFCGEGHKWEWEYAEEEACKIFGVDDGWGISDLLEKTEFEIAPTSDFFLDYVLSSRNDAEGDWGRTRRLGNAEYVKYGSKFHKLLKGREIKPNELRLVEYCWYDCSEAPDYFDESTYHDDFYDEV